MIEETARQVVRASELAVLQRLVPRLKVYRWDRLFWVWLSRLWTGWQSTLLIVQLANPRVAFSSTGAGGPEADPGDVLQPRGVKHPARERRVTRRPSDWQRSAEERPTSRQAPQEADARKVRAAGRRRGRRRSSRAAEEAAQRVCGLFGGLFRKKVAGIERATLGRWRTKQPHSDVACNRRTVV